MDEDHAGRLISRAVILAIVDQHVAAMHVLVLVTGHAGDDRHAGEMLGGPFDLLRRRPFAERQAGQDRRLQMPDAIEQQASIGHFRQRAVEILGLRQPAPEAAAAVLALIVANGHAEQSARSFVEVGKHAVGVEEQPRLVHQKRAGSNSTGIGASI